MKLGYGFLGLFMFVGVTPVFSSIDVKMQEEPKQAVKIFSESRVQEFISDIKSGVFGRTLQRKEVFGISISAKYFSNLSIQAQEFMARKILALENEYGLKRFYSSVVGQKQELSTQNFIRLMGVAIPTDNTVKSEKLLSPFAQRWAYQESAANGPNCWHNSMSSLSRSFKSPRYMGPNEFRCLVTNYFRPSTQDEKNNAEWGDLITLTTESDEEIHGIVHLGTSKFEDGDDISIFTKNGYAQSAYSFMKYTDVYKMYAAMGGTKATFYKMTHEPIDPSEDKHAVCFKQYNDEIIETVQDVKYPELEYILR